MNFKIIVGAHEVAIVDDYMSYEFGECYLVQELNCGFYEEVPSAAAAIRASFHLIALVAEKVGFLYELTPFYWQSVGDAEF